MISSFEVVRKVGKENVATVYLLRSRLDKNVFIECVESLDPPKEPKEKWVITLSSQKGCPVGCSFCDASYYYKGNLSKEEIFDQLYVIIQNHHNDEYLLSKKIKVHLARMGEPSFNDYVLDFLEELQEKFKKVNFIPSIATVAPKGRMNWFKKLKSIKDKYYKLGRFQLQFSLNTTDESFRDKLIPIKKISFEEIKNFGESWLNEGDRKVTLNFALSDEAPFCSKNLMKIFPKEKFLIKITPLNPRLEGNGLSSLLDYSGKIPQKLSKEIEELQKNDYEVIISIGSEEEIKIRSNCGQIAFKEVHFTENMTPP